MFTMQPFEARSSGKAELCHQIQAADVDPEDAVEVVRFGFLHAADQSDAGVIDQDVQLFNFGHSVRAAASSVISKIL